MVTPTSPSPLLPSSPRSPSSPGSSISSTPRITLSPLNPASTSTKPIAVPTSSKEQNALPLRVYHRGRSTSELSDLTDHPTVKVTSTHGTSSSLPSSNGFDNRMESTFRDRSRSPGPRNSSDQAELPDHPLSNSWWGEKHVARPSHDPPKKQRTISSEQTEDNTRKKVAQAVASALGTAADITHEVLYIGVDLLEFAPIPGLKPAATLLLNIWDASLQVDMNRLACLRLIERCADILISVREEISDAGDVVGQELSAPIQKLEESFQTIYHFLTKQASRPFLKRYLKRDEILRDISACDNSLRDALSLFGVSIQIRILKQVREAEEHRQVETKALLEAIMTGRLPLPAPDYKITIDDTTPPSNTYQSETVAHFTTTENALGLFENNATQIPSLPPLKDLPPPEIIPTLASLHSVQNSLDTAMDTAYLRLLMRNALQTMSDAELIEVLQVGREEIPDALKTLQRALERVAQRGDDGVEALPGKGVMLAKVVRKVSLKEVEGRGGPLKKSKTIISIDSLSSSGSSTSTHKKDTLDREFIESGIDAMQRMSVGYDLETLPSWTITRYEVDRDKKIGVGFFSDVYKGIWRGQVVAIKVLAETTPRKLFISEIGIWKTLSHRNVLPLYGASSASGDPPWFFVTSYMKNGSLVEYLRRVESEARSSNLGLGVGGPTQMPLSPIPSIGSRLQSAASWTAVRGISPSRLTPPDSRGKTPPQEDTPIHREWDLFRFMHEITKGMEYLHSRGVLHGDLKGANVLVDDKYRCVISDFGQSEMKSEAYRISGNPIPHGTLRWQSPELMAGQSQLTQAIDVWAFSICCVEILTMGRVPWALMDDDSVRHFITKDDIRPPLPDNSRFNTQGLQDILRACWSTKPAQRPSFAKLDKDFRQLRKNSGQEIVDSPRIPAIDEVPEIVDSPSPDLRPIDLPGFLHTMDGELPNDVLPDLRGAFASNPEIGVSTDTVVQTPLPSSRASSIFIPASRSEEHLNVVDYDGYDSPPPTDERIANIKNERRYRLLLTHDYHSSLTLPLWDPSPIEVGAVGHLLKPRGHFVTLFNALSPVKSKHPEIQALPSIHGYGPAGTGTHRQDRRTVAQKGRDVFNSLLPFGTFPKETVSRHYSAPLNVGHKMAWLCAETTDYRYLESLDAPKRWFRTNVDTIMRTFGTQYHIQKEDLFLVIGTLSAANYALFVSHNHPEGHALFNVYATPKNGKPWGTFDTDARVASGPSYDEPDSDITVQAKKISRHGGPWDTVLLARLRFKPDVLEPTSK